MFWIWIINDKYLPFLCANINTIPKWMMHVLRHVTKGWTWWVGTMYKYRTMVHNRIIKMKLYTSLLDWEKVLIGSTLLWNLRHLIITQKVFNKISPFHNMAPSPLSKQNASCTTWQEILLLCVRHLPNFV